MRVVRAILHTPERAGRIAAILALTLATAGCITNGPSPYDARGTTVAFESIEGPPTAVAQRMVRSLNEEATARQIFVVPPGGQAQYRIRGYLAAQPASIAWAWDIYDAAQQRAFRLRGEEQLIGPRSWAATDDVILRRIARTSVEQFVAFVANPRAAVVVEQQPPSRVRSLVAAIDDFRPEAAGIFQILSAPPNRKAEQAEAARDVPLPRHRPFREPPALAYGE
jgi:hypothetical protein